MRSNGYAKNGSVHLAYQVDGDGPDLCYLSTNTLPLDELDDEPHAAGFFRRLAAFSRLIRYDPRGVGSSDPIDFAVGMTPVEAANDALAVFDAAGSERVHIVAEDGGVGIVMELAVAHPERVASIIAINGYARVMQGDDYPHGYPPEFIESFVTDVVDPTAEWSLEGSDDRELIAPSLKDDPSFAQWWARASRRGASPANAAALLRMTALSDTRHCLPLITVPTLVIHRRDNFFVPIGCGRYVAENIVGARFVELPGDDQLPWAGDSDAIADEIEEFVTGHRSGGIERVLATVLFTDIVDSTRRAAELGDRKWRALLESHDTVIRRELARFGGREVNTTGDGFLAVFDLPTQAIRAARSIGAACAAAGVPVRAGLHTGECEQRGRDLAGLAVHISARVAALAGEGEIYVSRTVRDLVTGSGLEFAPRGEHQLKGVPDTWQLFVLEG